TRVRGPDQGTEERARTSAQALSGTRGHPSARETKKAQKDSEKEV
ncbi:uncharacterized protein METZ01_LOCUS467347, partial [marine metagenome]